MSDDFLEALLKIRRAGEESGEPEDGESARTFFDRLLEFANECYIHGVTVGIKTAAEIYGEHTKE